MRIAKSKFNYLAVNLFFDMFVVAASFFLAYHIRFNSYITVIFPAYKGIPSLDIYINAMFFIVPLFLFFFSKSGYYENYFLPFLDEFVRAFKTVTLVLIVILLSTFFYRDVSYSRLTFLIFWMFAIAGIVIYREIFKISAKYILRRFFALENLLIVGKENRLLRSIFKKHMHYQIYYHPDEDEAGMEAIKRTIIEKDVRQVILTKIKWTEDALLKMYDWCAKINVDLKFVPDIVQICRGEIAIDSSLGIPIFHLLPISLSGLNFYFKRVLDLVLSIMIFSFIWPFLMMAAIIIKLDSKGPALYFHKRMGYRGRVFNFHKFRTMVLEADQLLEKFKNMSERLGPVFKMADDPRVTKIGKFLRRFSIDEIPQLLNVLRGEMSLVGPRPQVLWEAEAYDDWAKRRLRVLPGITGLWQVSGRASLSYEEMIELDIFYIENWSLGLDIEILFKTVPTIFSKRGAY